MPVDFSKMNTYDWVDSDLDKWEAQLHKITALIDQGEISRDGDEFRQARLAVRDMLADIAHTRSFIQFKRYMVANTTADVETLFGAGPAETRTDAPAEDLRWQDEDRSE